MKISSWSVWLLHYRLLSSHHYSIWAPSSSTLNTTTNICHVLFAFASSPLGKMHLQWDARFWWGFSVWDWFWVCFLTRKMHSSKFQWEKVRWKKDVALGVVRRSICRGPYVCGQALFSFLRLIWRNCWPYWDVFFGREAELNLPENQEQACSLPDCSRWICSLLHPNHESGTAPQRTAALCPCYSAGWTEGLLLETVVWELEAWIHTHRGLWLSKGRIFCLRGSKIDAILELLVLVQEGVDFSFEGAWHFSSEAGSYILSALLTIMIAHC